MLCGSALAEDGAGGACAPMTPLVAESVSGGAAPTAGVLALDVRRPSRHPVPMGSTALIPAGKLLIVRA